LYDFSQRRDRRVCAGDDRRHARKRNDRARPRDRHLAGFRRCLFDGLWRRLCRDFRFRLCGRLLRLDRLAGCGLADVAAGCFAAVGFAAVCFAGAGFADVCLAVSGFADCAAAGRLINGAVSSSTTTLEVDR
jgi:hypothetical protein